MMVDNKTSTTNNLHLPPFTTFQPLNTTVPYSPTVSLVLSFSRSDQRRRHCSSEVLRRSFFAAIGRSLRRDLQTFLLMRSGTIILKKQILEQRTLLKRLVRLHLRDLFLMRQPITLVIIQGGQPLAHRAGDNR